MQCPDMPTRLEDVDLVASEEAAASEEAVALEEVGATSSMRQV